MHVNTFSTSKTLAMSVTNLNDFPFGPFHEASASMSSAKLAVLIVGLIKFTLLQILLHRKVIASIFSALQSWVFHEEEHDHAASRKKMDVEEIVGSDDESVCGGEMEMVLRNLGICWQEKEKIPARAIFEIFEERNPSLDEVREAFDVFDENRDGFIDEKELQRVLCALGFNEGLEMENCRRMIGGVDEDGDGKIDFHEFVKFMENSFI